MSGASKTLRGALSCAGLFAVMVAPVAAQDSNILFPVEELERLLRDEPFEVLGMHDTRFEGDRTQRVTLKLANDAVVAVKWARAPRGGHEFNNAPRYEIGAYQVQKLFLDPEDYVVPPTVLRPVDAEWYREHDPAVGETFHGTGVVFVVLQYWLFNVTDEGVWDEDRFEADPAYARHFANMNLLTYLIRHNDSNKGNALISTDPANPRVFSVDNGLAFGREFSDRGTDWRDLRIDRLPRESVERLRAVTEEELNRFLVMAQFEERDGAWVHVEPAEPVNRNRGVTRDDGVIQFGLTAGEVRGLWRRLEGLLDEVDDGDIAVF